MANKNYEIKELVEMYRAIDNTDNLPFIFVEEDLETRKEEYELLKAGRYECTDEYAKKLKASLNDDTLYYSVFGMNGATYGMAYDLFTDDESEEIEVKWAEHFKDAIISLYESENKPKIDELTDENEKLAFMSNLEMRAEIVGNRAKAGDLDAKELYDTWQEIVKDGKASYMEINLISDDIDNYLETYAIENKNNRVKKALGL